MPTVEAPTKKRRSREETRQRLLDAAIKVFALNGYERATVDEIVREAGFSKGAFYVHFESKEDLFWEMLQERIDAQQELFRQAMDENESVAENERRILEAMFTMSKGPIGPAILLEFTAHGMRNEKVRERLSAMYERWHAFAVETIEQGRASGKVRADVDPSLLASVLIAIFEGSMIQSQFAPERLRLSGRVPELARVLAGLVAPDAAS
jgi:AcrR family transcriptional regulator